MTLVVIPNAVAICAVDPGGITAVSRGVFPIAGCDSVAESFAAGRLHETWEIEGPVVEQVDELCAELGDWLIERHVFDLMPLPDLHVVLEDFKLRQRSADLRPVEILAAFRQEWNASHGSWVEIEYQTPADAKRYVTNERLRRWGGWVRGSDHRRDANRHLLLKLSRLLG